MEKLLEGPSGETGGDARLEDERYVLEFICSRCGSIGTTSSFVPAAYLAYSDIGPEEEPIEDSIDIRRTAKKYGWHYRGDSLLCPVCTNGLVNYLQGD